jgi:hypothetical protein
MTSAETTALIGGAASTHGLLIDPHPRHGLTTQPPHSLPQLLITRMWVDDRSEPSKVIRRPLRQEEISGRSVDICHGRVPWRIDPNDLANRSLGANSPNETYWTLDLDHNE